MTVQPRPPERPEDRRAVRYEDLELRVDLQAPSLACSRCGDIILAGEYRSATGRCVDCVGRGGSLFAWIVGLAIAGIVLFVVVAFVVSLLAAPRSAAQVNPLTAEGDTPEQLTEAPLLVAGARAPELSSSRQEGASLVTGSVTWYCSDGRDGSRRSDCTRGYGPDDRVAAIARGLGFSKGDVVTVTYNGRSVTVRIVDVCGCPDDRSIDLTIGAFQELAPWGLGVLHGARIEAGRRPRVTLPPTDVAP